MDKPVVVAGFPITSDVSLRKRGAHEGIAYEVVNHGRSKADFIGGEFTNAPSGGTWCYYVTIGEAMLPPELFTEFWLPARAHPHKSGWPRLHYDYYAARFAQANWHGGVTFYEKSGGMDGSQRYVRIGCDFAHSWDEGHDFDFAQVECEAIATVKQLREMYAFYRRCPYFGTYQPESEMVTHTNGALYSKDGIAEMVKP